MLQIDSQSGIWLVEKTNDSGDRKAIGRVYLTREEARDNARMRRERKPWNRYTVRRYIWTNVRA